MGAAEGAGISFLRRSLRAERRGWSVWLHPSPSLPVKGREFLWLGRDCAKSLSPHLPLAGEDGRGVPAERRLQVNIPCAPWKNRPRSLTPRGHTRSGAKNREPFDGPQTPFLAAFVQGGYRGRKAFSADAADPVGGVSAGVCR